jgi:hypothetical protein
VTYDDREDQELHELARRLGARAEQRLDVERTAQAVLARLARPEPRVPWIARPTVWLRIAAVVAFVVGGGIVLRNAKPGHQPVATAVAAGVNLNDLSADDLTEMLRTFDQSLDQEPVDGEMGLDDLTAPELRRLLHSLEG